MSYFIKITSLVYHSAVYYAPYANYEISYTFLRKEAYNFTSYEEAKLKVLHIKAFTGYPNNKLYTHFDIMCTMSL